MLKKLAAAALAASLLPAAALACEGHAAEQRAVAPVEKKQPLMLAQNLNMKELQKMGNNAGAQIKKDADKVQLDKKLDGATSKKKKPTAKQVSAPKK